VGVTAAAGFVAAGAAGGIKAGGTPDVALVATDDGVAVPAAAVFTRNRAAAAPVLASRAHLARTGGRAAAVILSSGNANAATGAPGRAAAEQLCALVGDGLGVPAEEVLVCQTGLIGVPFPIRVVAPAVPGLVAARRPGAAAGEAAARAIMTTDTMAKEVQVDGGGFVVGGMAKGAAMLAPDMATMLAVLTTDAALDPATLAGVLRAAVGPTFNRLTVDGCTSTNDTVVLLASGRAGPVDPARVEAAATEACGTLAALMAEDAEGATKVVHIEVTGAATDDEAHRAARRVAESMLVKCSLNGEDPYWGRVVSELGTAGVAYEHDRVAVFYGGVAVCGGGAAAEHDRAAVAAHLAGRHLRIRCDLGLGSGSGVVLTTDLGHGYIDENRTTS
jgi:glutamate N-acetyltransferase/amino-acid N-acetyltransferase